MAEKKKGLAALIIAKAKPKESPMQDVDPLVSAAEEIVQAMDAKDPQMLMESLKAFVEMCKDEEYPDEEME